MGADILSGEADLNYALEQSQMEAAIQASLDTAATSATTAATSADAFEDECKAEGGDVEMEGISSRS